MLLNHDASIYSKTLSGVPRHHETAWHVNVWFCCDICNHGCNVDCGRPKQYNSRLDCRQYSQEHSARRGLGRLALWEITNVKFKQVNGHEGLRR